MKHSVLCQGLTSFHPTTTEVDIIPILQMRKLKPGVCGSKAGRGALRDIPPFWLHIREARKTERPRAALVAKNMVIY